MPPTARAGRPDVRLAHTGTKTESWGWTGRPGVVPEGEIRTHGDWPRASLDPSTLVDPRGPDDCRRFIG